MLMGLGGIWEKGTLPSPTGKQVGEEEEALGTRRDEEERTERGLGNDGHIRVIRGRGGSGGSLDTAFKMPKCIVLNERAVVGRHGENPLPDVDENVVVWGARIPVGRMPVVLLPLYFLGLWGHIERSGSRLRLRRHCTCLKRTRQVCRRKGFLSLRKNTCGGSGRPGTQGTLREKTLAVKVERKKKPRTRMIGRRRTLSLTRHRSSCSHYNNTIYMQKNALRVR